MWEVYETIPNENLQNLTFASMIKEKKHILKKKKHSKHFSTTKKHHDEKKAQKKPLLFFNNTCWEDCVYKKQLTFHFVKPWLCIKPGSFSETSMSSTAPGMTRAF